jgi:hypothetical protein
LGLPFRALGFEADVDAVLTLTLSQWKGFPLLLLRERRVELDGSRTGLCPPILTETSWRMLARRFSDGDPVAETVDVRLGRRVGVISFCTPRPEWSRELDDETRLRQTRSAEQIWGTERRSTRLLEELALELEEDDRRGPDSPPELSTTWPRVFRTLMYGLGPQTRELATCWSSACSLASTSWRTLRGWSMDGRSTTGLGMSTELLAEWLLLEEKDMRDSETSWGSMSPLVRGEGVGSGGIGPEGGLVIGAPMLSERTRRGDGSTEVALPKTSQSAKDGGRMPADADRVTMVSFGLG